jgi:hypothetical protein
MALVRKIHARHANVTVLDGRHSGFGHGAFADAQHLDLEGATALSAALAQAMAPRLEGRAGGDRWVELPKGVVPAGRPPIEDMDESRMTLGRLAARR